MPSVDGRDSSPANAITKLRCSAFDSAFGKATSIM